MRGIKVPDERHFIQSYLHYKAGRLRLKGHPLREVTRLSGLAFEYVERKFRLIFPEDWGLQARLM
jgi:hypothetical protein